MTLLDVAAYQQKIKLSHRLEDWGYIDCFLKPMQITLLKKKERKLEISFQFYRCKINSFHCNTGHPDVQDVGSIRVAFMNLTYTCDVRSGSSSTQQYG